MRLTCEFESFEEMMEFAAKLQQGNGKHFIEIDVEAAAQEAVREVATAAPVNTPVQTTPVQVSQVQQNTEPLASQNIPQTMAPTPIQTSTPTYTLDDLSRAAMTLMDRGMQAQLQQLLAGYGVVSLPDLPKEQYGNFATALRGMGAQI